MPFVMGDAEDTRPSWLRYAGWALVPLLLFLFGQYLEGPPYRVIVRSGPFLIAVVGVTALASTFVWHLLRYPPLLGFIYVVTVSMGFIWSAQHYYDGGKHSDYLAFLLLWAVPMGINCSLFLNSLFAPFKLVSPQGEVAVEHSDAEWPVGHFDVRLFTVSQDGGREHLYYELRGGPPLPEGFFLDGYSHDHFVSLKEHWGLIMEQRLHRFTTPITLYETIIKFGETQQLVQKYELEIETFFNG
ncbi:hypothetical protein [Desulfuromonas acetoxidans]|nr:hypothetical protein [Desulfuromonas acetoxidans]